MKKLEHLKNHTSAKANGITVLMVNLGSPDTPDAKGVRKYLKEFLSDTRVIEIPPIAWQFILRGIILNTRPKRVAHAYDSVWMYKEDNEGYSGSPLTVYSQKITDKLQNHFGNRVTIRLAMRYGNPSLKKTLNEILASDESRVLILPMYPQYSATTTATALDQVFKFTRKMRFVPEIRSVRSYCHESSYLDALANKIKTFWETHAKPEKLIFSFHGIPQVNITKGDRYYADCLSTSKGVIERLGLKENEYLTTFQSRFGPQQWLQPYTDKTLEKLAKDGTKSIHILSPAFAADCLETLEELNVENRDIFINNGGKKFEYIPALNDDNSHIDFFASLIEKNISGWEND